MRRRDLSKALIASAGGVALVTQNANAQTCAAPCYPPTQAERDASVTVVNQAHLPGDVRRYGAVGNAIADDSTALQRAIDAAMKGGYTVYLPKGKYRIAKQVKKLMDFICPSIKGDGYKHTIILCDPLLQGQAALYIQGGSGQPCGAVIEDICFDGLNKYAGAYGIEVDGQNHLTIRNCEFGFNAVGLRLHNKTFVIIDNKKYGAFTEYVVAENCNFRTDCRRALEYVVSDGAESFNGSGLRNCLVGFSEDSDVAVYVGPGAFPYHAPMSMQVWTYGAKKTIMWSDATARVPLFHGTITVEPFGGFDSVVDSPRLAGGRPVQLVGNVAAAGYVDYGTLQVGTHAARLGPEGGRANGTSPIRRHPWSLRMQLASGKNEVDYVGDDSGQLVYVELTGDYYDFRYLLAIAHEGFGGVGFVQTVATLRANSSVGAPTFSVDPNGKFVITNNASVAVTAYIDFQPFGLSRRSYLNGAVEYDAVESRR